MQNSSPPFLPSNVFFGKNYLFSISSLNYHFLENSKDEFSKSIRVEPISQTDRDIKFRNNNLIERIEVNVTKEKNNCEMKYYPNKSYKNSNQI